MKKLIIITLLLLLSVPKLWAGWKIVIHQNESGIQEVVTYHISKNGIKISNSEFDFIYYKTAEKIIVVSHRTKSFFFGSFDDYSSQLKDLFTIDSKRTYQALPISYMLRFHNLLVQIISEIQEDNRRTTPSIHVKNTNNEKRITDYTAQEYHVYFDTTLIEPIWLSPDVRIKDDLDIMEVYNFFQGSTSSALSKNKTVNTTEYEQLKYNGFPMKLVNLDSYGFEIFSSEVVLIQELELDEEVTFSPPAKYQKITLVDIIMAKD